MGVMSSKFFKRITVAGMIGSGVFAVILLALSTLAVSTDTAVAQGRPAFELPDNAKPVSPGVFSLGEAIVDGVVVEGYAFLHPARGAAKPDNPGGGNGGGNGGGKGKPAVAVI
jgi:hypothetical protein